MSLLSYPYDLPREVPLLFAFYRACSRGMEMSSNLPKVTELVDADLGIKQRQCDSRVNIYSATLPPKMVAYEITKVAA